MKRFLLILILTIAVTSSYAQRGLTGLKLIEAKKVRVDTLEYRGENIDFADLKSRAKFVGNYDISGGTFPVGSNVGDLYKLSTNGTVNDTLYHTGDMLLSIKENASTSVLGGNWLLIDNSDNGEITGNETAFTGWDKNAADDLTIGETISTAYRGDRGKTAYDHSQIVTSNPHVVTKSEVGLGNVDNTSDLNKPVSTATQTALNLKVDKVAGKGLSTEDYTTAEKNKLSGIASGAEVNVNADWNSVTGDSQIFNRPNLSTVATSGNHSDLNGSGSNSHAQIDTHISSTSNPHSVTKTQVGLSNVTNDAQVKRSEMGVVNGVATLGVDGKLPSSQIPSLAISDTYVITNAADRVTLTAAEIGDVAIATAENESYILQTSPYSVAGNWQLIRTPDSPVQSVNGQTGNVSLDTDDISQGTTNLYYSDSYIDGNETAFTGWDKNASDDFNGAWSSLTGVPAGFSDGVDNVDDADNDPTNEIQDLSGLAPISGSPNYIQVSPVSPQTANIDITGNALFGGSLGVGVTSPAGKLNIKDVTYADVNLGTIILQAPATTIGDKLGITFAQTNVASRARAGIFSISETADGYTSSLGFFTGSGADGSGLENADEKVRITSTGRVGIGTTNPLSRLDIKASTTSAFTQRWLNSSGTYTGGVYNTGLGDSQFYLADNTGTDQILFATSGTQSSYINKGNFGIGTISPTSKLDVVGVSGTYPTVGIYHSANSVEGEFLRIGRSDSPTIRYHSIMAEQSGDAASSNYIAFKLHNFSTTTSQTEVLRMLGNGYVGIGTVSPVSGLNVRSITGAAFEYNSTGTRLDILPEAANGVVALRYRAYTGNAPDLVFKNDAGSEKLRIRNDGNVGIGTYAPQGKLQIGSTASALYGTLNIVQTSTSAPGFVRGIQLVHPSGTAEGVGGYMGISVSGLKTGTLQVGDDGSAGTLLLNPNGGYVGIGVSPTEKLDVAGNIKASSLAGTGERVVVTDTSGLLSPKAYSAINLNQLSSGSATINQLPFANGSSEVSWLTAPYEIDSITYDNDKYLRIYENDQSTPDSVFIDSGIQDNSVTYNKLSTEFKRKSTVTSSVDLSADAIGTISLSANTTFTFSNLKVNKTYTLIIDTNGFTPTFPSYCSPTTGSLEILGDYIYYIDFRCFNATTSSEDVLYTTFHRKNP